jgi:hypothetical protein
MLHIIMHIMEMLIILQEDMDIIHPKDIVQILQIKEISLHKTK